VHGSREERPKRYSVTEQVVGQFKERGDPWHFIGTGGTQEHNPHDLLTIFSSESGFRILYDPSDAIRLMSMLIRALQVIGWCFVIAAAAMAIFAAPHVGPIGEHPVIEYKDFVSILLTALGVMIAVAAVAAALGAVWGFEFLRREMNRIARETAIETAKKEVQTIVPGLVDEALAFSEQGKKVKADEVAQEYGREVGDGNQ
jgi:hypothetical protein